MTIARRFRFRSTRVVAIAATSLAALGTAVAAAPAAGADVTATFGFTGETQEFVVPSGVASVDIVACGASGAGTVASSGGLGGEATATIAVAADEVLTVVVGGAGAGATGGFNGGGDGGGVGGGGGGASDVRRGGVGLTDRVVVGGGGGGGGYLFVDGGGGEGGGLVGGDGGAPAPSGIVPAGGGTQTSGGDEGVGPDFSGSAGEQGNGGDGGLEAGGGGGGLFGGGGGGSVLIFPEAFGGGGGGGSGMGAAHVPGSCAGDGWVTITYSDSGLPSITPGAGAVVEGGAGSQTLVEVPVTLSHPSATVVTVDWATLDTGGAGVASAGVDYLVDSGTVTFAPGETTAHVELTVVGDDVDEPPLLYGEWGLLAFSNPSPNAVLDTSGFFGLGVFIIVDDD